MIKYEIRFSIINALMDWLFTDIFCHWCISTYCF